MSTRLSPKALPVFNLTEAILEETRMPKIIEFNQRRADDPQDEFPLPGMLCAVALGFLMTGGAFTLAYGLYRWAQWMWPCVGKCS